MHQPESATTPSAATLPSALLGGEVSPELAMPQLKKIQAFETLVKAKRFERAAMVADDIQSLRWRTLTHASTSQRSLRSSTQSW